MQLNFEQLKPQIAEILEVSLADIYPETRLDGNEMWDSFAMLSAVALVTEHTGKQIALEQLSKLATVTDFVEVCKQLQDS